MALRTDTASVQKLIERDTAAWEGCDQADLVTCMTTANIIVTNICAPSPLDPAPIIYDDTTLELIERWLSAHFLAVIDPSVGRLTVAQVATVKEQYSFKVGLLLDQTVYGQMAKTIDWQGFLAGWDNLNKIRLQKRIGTVKWFGVETPLEQYLDSLECG